MSDDRDDLAALSAALGGTTAGPRPEDFGLAFRPVESFLDAPAAPAVRLPVSRWLPPTLVAAAAVVLTVALLVPDVDAPREPEAAAPTTGAPPVTGTTGTASDLTNVAMVLREAADVSGAQPDQTDARYWRVDSIQQQSGNEVERRTIWLGHREPGLLIDDFGREKLPRATFSLQSTELTWDELVALPADPKALRELLDRDVADLPQGSTYVVKIAAGLLAETPAPPDLRRALWQVIAEVPGVVSRGAVQDSLGRTGVALSYAAPERGKQVYIVDPSTGRILETRLDVGRTGGTKFRVTYLTQGPADSTDP